MSFVIACKPDGSVEAMYCDNFQLSFLGKQKITRASEIQFNEDTQLWDIHVVTGEGLVTHETASGFRNYEEARCVEVRWFNSARAEDENPLSPRGIEILEETIQLQFIPSI